MKITVEFDSYEEFKGFEEFFAKKAFVNKKKPISILGLTIRTNNCLTNAGINTVDDLLKRTEIELLQIPNSCRKTVNEIKKAIDRKGLRIQSACFE
jgi:DNA-directed RNA polymerase alpha subunit